MVTKLKFALLPILLAGCMSESEWADFDAGLNNMYNNLLYQEPTSYIYYDDDDGCGSDGKYYWVC